MKKKLNISKHIKRLIAVIVVCLAALTLVSCDSANRISKGSINLNETYAKSGNLVVTNGELYDSLRYASADYLNNKIDLALYAEEIKTIKDNLNDYKDQLDSKILNDIYDTDDEDEISKKTTAAKDVLVKTYISEMFEQGYTITAEQIANKQFDSVYEVYYLEVAKRLAAINKLKEEVGMVDGKFPTPTADTYFTKTKVIDYYDDNMKNSGDVTAILIRFVSSDEAAKLLKKFGIVAYNNDWYLVKTPEKLEDYAKDSDWESYVTSSNREENSIEDSGNGIATIVKIFAELYNFIYQNSREQLVLDSGMTVLNFSDKGNLKYYFLAKAIVEKDGLYRAGLVESGDENTEYADLLAKVVEYNEVNGYATTVLSKEKMDSYSSSLTTYLTEKLSTAGGASDTQYTSKATDTYNSHVYLAIKLDQAPVDALYNEVKEDSTTTYNFDDHDEMVQKVCQEMFDALITDDYITEVYEERANDVEVKIYDSIVELEYMQSDATHASHYEKCKKSNANNIADITYNGVTTSVKADDLFNDLEAINGPAYALGLLFDKYMKTTSYYEKYNTKKYYDQYVQQIKNLTTYYSYGYYSSYGYDTDLGVYNFLRLVYQDNDIDNIIYDSLMVSAATSDFLNNAFKDESFLAKISEYAKKNYNDYYSMTATKVRVYLDRDEDGVADEFDSTLNNAYRNVLVKLRNEVISTAACYDEAISEAISDFDATTRFDSTDVSSNENYWGIFKQKGFVIATEDVTASNTTTDIEEEIQTALKAYYSDPTIINQEDGFISSILVDKFFQDENGYYALLLTAGTTKTSAKSEDENIKDLYTRIPVINDGKVEYIEISNYDSEMPTDEQIKVYVLDYLLLSDVNSLPAETIASLDAYVLPVLQRYSSTASKYQIILNTLDAIQFTNDNEANNAQLNQYIEYAKLSLDGYKTPTVYADWWTNMYSK